LHKFVLLSIILHTDNMLYQLDWVICRTNCDVSASVSVSH